MNPSSTLLTPYSIVSLRTEVSEENTQSRGLPLSVPRGPDHDLVSTILDVVGYLTWWR